MNPLDGDLEFQRRKAHEERRAVIENALRARGFSPEDAAILVAEYTAGVLRDAVDMTFDPEKPYFGHAFKKGREGWWWRGTLSARHAIARLERWENQKIDRLIRAKTPEDTP